jgi:hypothetical protein
LKVPFGYDVRDLDQTIRQGGFAVIDMSDDTEISYVLHRFDYEKNEIMLSISEITGLLQRQPQKRVDTPPVSSYSMLL